MLENASAQVRLLESLFYLCEHYASEKTPCHVEFITSPREPGYAKWLAAIPIPDELLVAPDDCSRYVASYLLDRLDCDLARLRSVGLDISYGDDGQENGVPYFFAIWMKRKDDNPK